MAMSLLESGFAGDAGAPVAVGVRLSQDESTAKSVFDPSRSVDASASALASPDRIVVDMPEVNFQLDPSVGRVARYGQYFAYFAREGFSLRAARPRQVPDRCRPRARRLSGSGFGQTDRRRRTGCAAYDRAAASVIPQLLRRLSVRLLFQPQARLPRRLKCRRSSSLIRGTVASTAARADFTGCRRRPWFLISAPN